MDASMKLFWNKVDITENCWLWTGALIGNGYAQHGTYPNAQLVHRISYRYHIGEIKDGMQIDHLCKVRNCVNPDHLEQVTQQENMKRSSVLEHSLGLTHCKHGHEFTKENTIWRNERHRSCRTCTRRRYREHYWRVKLIKNKLI